MKLNSSVIKLVLSALFLLSVLCFAGCPEDVTEDKSISEVTITNIPEHISVNNNENASAPTFKVYLYASNHMEADKPPVAKGLIKVTNPMLSNGTYTVKLQLQNPNPDNDVNPNLNTGSWSGTAIFFSVMISPQETSVNGVDSVWIKGGYTLDKGKMNINWNNLIDFRGSSMNFDDKAEALYDDIICNDPDINSN